MARVTIPFALDLDADGLAAGSVGLAAALLQSEQRAAEKTGGGASCHKAFKCRIQADAAVNGSRARTVALHEKK